MTGRKVNDEKFIKMWNEDASYKDIQKEFGIAYISVYSASKRLLLKRRIPKRDRVHDEDIIAFIKEKGICSYEEICKKFRVSLGTPSKRLRSLVRKGLITGFVLKIGTSGTSGRGGVKSSDSRELFNGFRYSPNPNYYYVDENVASKILIEKLQLNPSLPQYKRKRLTSYLRRALKPSMFQLLYNSYRSKRTYSNRDVHGH